MKERSRVFLMLMLAMVVAATVTWCHREPVGGNAGATAGSTDTGGTAGTTENTSPGGSGGGGNETAGDSAAALPDGGKGCGGSTGEGCGPMEWCSFSRGDCGADNHPGQCRPLEQGNGDDCTSPVCGCDGRAYCNAWAAHRMGSDTSGSKSCITGNGDLGAAC